MRVQRSQQLWCLGRCDLLVGGMAQAEARLRCGGVLVKGQTSETEHVQLAQHSNDFLAMPMVQAEASALRRVHVKVPAASSTTGGRRSEVDRRLDSLVRSPPTVLNTLSPKHA